MEHTCFATNPSLKSPTATELDCRQSVSRGSGDGCEGGTGVSSGGDSPPACIERSPFSLLQRLKSGMCTLAFPIRGILLYTRPCSPQVLAPASMAMGAAILRLGALPTSRPSPRRSLPNELSDWHMRAAIKGTGANSARSDSSAGLRSDASVSRQRRTSSMRSESILNSWREEVSLRRSSTQGHPPQCQQRATTPRRRSSINMVQVPLAHHGSI